MVLCRVSVTEQLPAGTPSWTPWLCSVGAVSALPEAGILQIPVACGSVARQLCNLGQLCSGPLLDSKTGMLLSEVAVVYLRV